MIAIALLLQRARQEHPALRALTLDGRSIQVKLSTDPGAREPVYPRLVVEISSREASDTNAMVPLEIVETLTLASEAETPKDLVRFANALFTTVRGTSIAGPAGTFIHRMLLRNASFEGDIGEIQKATLTWDVRASWREAA